MKSVLEVRRFNEIGSVNPLPYCFIFGSTSGWLLYGATVSNLYIWWANCPGLVLATFYILSCHSALEKGRRKIVYEIVTLTVLMVALTCAFLAAFILAKTPGDVLLGTFANTMLVCFYASPLSTSVAVIRLKDASSLDPLLCAMNSVNGTMWTIYGFALKDPIVWSLNLLGAILGVVQLLLIGIYGRNNSIALNSSGSKSQMNDQVVSHLQSPEGINYGTSTPERRTRDGQE
eukprot:jgi/Galph1/3973/GphlegSOOS_G2622.1